MARTISSEAEEILDVKVKVLDKGFVCLVDYMGGDERVVRAARVSYGKSVSTPERDAILINYLIENEHTSPFEQVVLTFHIRVPIFVDRQIVRHRTQRRSEISGRYSVLPADYYSPEEWRIQDTENRQGSLVPPGGFSGEDPELGYTHQCNQSVKGYHELLEAGVAKEMARMVLPLSTYTEYFFQMDLHNLFHFLKLRLHEHAQWEVRQYAEVMMDMAEKVAPVSCAAFKKHVLGTVRVPRDQYLKFLSLSEEEKK